MDEREFDFRVKFAAGGQAHVVIPAASLREALVTLDKRLTSAKRVEHSTILQPTVVRTEA